jgi:hypothetical protein
VNRSRAAARATKEQPVKYLLTIYGNDELWASWSPEETQKAITEQDAFNVKYAKSGELLGAYGLGSEAQARVVSVRDGKPVVTDGPYLETKEYMGSFYLLDVESDERALEIAADIPFASFRSVELWPILHEAGEEM